MITEERKLQLRKYGIMMYLKALGEEYSTQFESVCKPTDQKEKDYIDQERTTTLKRITDDLRSKARKGEQLSDQLIGDAVRGKKIRKAAKAGGDAKRKAEGHKYDRDKIIKRIREIMEENDQISFVQARRLSVKGLPVSEAWAKKHIRKIDI